MMLEWKGAPGNVIAHGANRLYTIQTVGARYVLQGIGHDDLSLLVLPPFGRQFDTLDQAKTHANTLERTATAEPQVGVE